MSKRILRKEIKALLVKIPKFQLLSESHALLANLCKMRQFQTAQRISIYLSMPNSEIQTEPILRYLFGQRKHVYVPKVFQSGMEMIQLKSLQEYHSLPSNAWGIKEHDTDDVEFPKLDLILLPCLAFDRSRNRLGQGKGYYDTFIDRYTKKWGERPLLIGLALKDQIFGEVPTEPHDIPVDFVVTCNETIG